MSEIPAFIAKRLLSIFVTVSVILTVGYVLMYYSPGSFFNSSNISQAIAGLAAENPRLYQQVMAEFDARYGLNQPLYEQVWKYVTHSLTFNFGTSFENPTTQIMTQLKTAFPISAELAFGAIFLGLIVGLPLGVAAGIKRNTLIDRIAVGISMVGQAIPAFVLAVFLVLIFGTVIPNVLPVNGWGAPADYVLPIVCLGAANIGVVTRYMRNGLIEVMRQDYMRTAEAKGVKYWHRVLKHGVRNSVVALITIIGPAFAFTVVSTVWVENVFSIPGMGTLMANAFVFKDVPLSVVSIYILAMMVLVVNMLVDIAYKLIDPRVHLS